jgi:hypothetical protein
VAPLHSDNQHSAPNNHGKFFRRASALTCPCLPSCRQHASRPIPAPVNFTNTHCVAASSSATIHITRIALFRDLRARRLSASRRHTHTHTNLCVHLHLFSACTAQRFFIRREAREVCAQVATHNTHAHQLPTLHPQSFSTASCRGPTTTRVCFEASRLAPTTAIYPKPARG